jgi:hypothetical protein
MFFVVTFELIEVDHYYQLLILYDIQKTDIFIHRIVKPFGVLRLLLSFEEEIVGFDCLTRTNGVGEGAVVGLSSDFVCRGGIGGGRGRFFFDSLSRKTTGKESL